MCYLMPSSISNLRTTSMRRWQASSYLLSSRNRLKPFVPSPSNYMACLLEWDCELVVALDAGLDVLHHFAQFLVVLEQRRVLDWCRSRAPLLDAE